MVKNKNPFSYKSANDATGFLLWKTHNYWQREIKKCLNEFDLTHTQFVVLANTQWLINHNGEVTQVEIARHAQIDVMMTSNVIRALMKKDILQRKEHTKDTRAKLVSLTNKGIIVLNKSVKAVEKFDRQFFNKLEDSEKFNRELLGLCKNIKAT